MSYLNRNLTLSANQFEIVNQINPPNDDTMNKTETLCCSKLFINKVDSGSFCQYDQTNQSYQVGSYVLDRVIGKGNFSVVKLATHIPTQMQVAVKVLHKSKMTRETLEKTYREVQIMKRLRHSNIVQLYQVIESSDWMFIIMEYVPLGELFDYLSQVGRLTENDARVKFRQMLDAIEYCHNMNIVHRDLKAENLLMDENFNIKLADFGFGSFYDESSLLSTWCGSPPYAAPELFRGEPYIGPKSDIWSLGVVLYAMVCGTLPFDEPSSIVKLRIQVLSGLIRFPYFLSYDCELLIRKILNRNPNKRPSIPSIRNHKWMQPTNDNDNTVFVDTLPITDKSLWRGPVQSRSTRRCKTMCDDSGFDEPFDFTQSNSEMRALSLNQDCMDYDVNDNVMQLMERCGFKRSSIIEELNQNTFGNLTATYLLLCQKLRVHHQTKSPASSDYNISQAVLANTCIIDNRLTARYYKVDDLTNTESDTKMMHIGDIPQQITVDRGSQYDNRRKTIHQCQSNLYAVTKPNGNGNESSRIVSNLTETKQIDIPNNTVNNRHLTSVMVDMVIPHVNNIDDNKHCPNMFNSSSGKPPFYNANRHFMETRRIHTCSMTDSREMEIMSINGNITVQPCIIVNPKTTVQYLPIKPTPQSNNEQLGFQLSTIDRLGRYQQQSNIMGQISSLYNVPKDPPSVHGFNAHSSPLKSALVNDICNTVKPQITKFCHLTMPRVRWDQTICPRATVILPNPKTDQTSNLVCDIENKRKLPQSCHQASDIEQEYYLPRSNPYESSLLTSENCNQQTIPTSDANRVVIRQSLSPGNKSLSGYSEICPQIIPQYKIVQVSQISPVNINFIRLS